MSIYRIKAVVSKIDGTYAYLQGTREYSWVSPQGKFFSVLEKNKSEEDPKLVEEIKIEIKLEENKIFTECLSQSFCHGIPFMFGLKKESGENLYTIESISKNGDE